jgi:hypothetical protein
MLERLPLFSSCRKNYYKIDRTLEHFHQIWKAGGLCIWCHARRSLRRASRKLKGIAASVWLHSLCSDIRPGLCSGSERSKYIVSSMRFGKLRALSPSKGGTGYFRVQLPDLKSAECGGPAHVVPGLIVTLGT